MMNDYFLLTSRLFSPLTAVLDSNAIFSHLSKTTSVKVDFLVVFMLILVMPFGVRSKSIRNISGLSTSQKGCFNYLLNSTSVAGRGGGGGHGLGVRWKPKPDKFVFYRNSFRKILTYNDYNLIKI